MKTLIHISALVALIASHSVGAATPKANLVLLIVVDQFRADYLTRYESSLSERGFKRLMKMGSTFPFAEYDILQSMTGPGHSVISTGANPHYSGIAGNNWFDFSAQKKRYCVDDASSPLVPSALAKEGVGYSPKNLLTSTVGDELKNAGYPSRVVSIALKDRAAILMGGHRADLALWLHEPSLSWVSSRHYLPQGQLPPFVEMLNASLQKRKSQIFKWGADGKPSSLLTTDVPTGADHGKLPATLFGAFPHQVEIGQPGTLLAPFGTQITLEAVEMAWNYYGFGRKVQPDFLAVSFSSFDYAGHTYGPNSREMEHMLVSQDKAIAQLLDLADKRVPGGLAKTWVVLTSDHGVAPVPEWLKQHGLEAGRIDEGALQNKMEVALQAKFGSAPGNEKWVLGFSDLHFFLNSKTIEAREGNLSEYERVASLAVEKEPGIFQVVTGSDVQNRRLPSGFLERQILNTYFKGRSANIMIVPKPFFIPNDAPVTHVTGYAYDRQVPIIFTGPGILAKRHAALAHVNDIAPTLSFLLGTVAPALSEGRVLSEILHE